MKKSIFAAILAVAFVGAAHASGYGNNNNGGSTYDYRNGNTYNRHGTGYSGHNANTGSTWNAQSYGNTNRGTDSHGNNWSYNQNTGVYHNYGTGEIRQHGQRW